MKSIKLSLLVVVIAFHLLSCVSVPNDNNATEIVYREISYDILSDTLKSINRPGNGFIVQSYFYGELANGFYRLSDRPNDSYLGKESQWFKLNSNFNIQNLNIKIDKSVKYSIYIGIYYDQSEKEWVAFIDKIDGLISDEELIASSIQKTATEVKEKSERDASLDIKAKSIAKGYIYHGVAEDSQSGKLFNSGALEPGHAYYVSGFIVGGGGLTGGVITSLFIDPTFHIVEYFNQTVKGDVVGASQTTFGIKPVAIVVVGGTSPLYMPLVLGLVISLK